MTELREKHHLTQVELAKKTRLPQAQISRIERGVVRPTSATRAKIAEALGADIRLVDWPQRRARRSAAGLTDEAPSRLASERLIPRISRGRRRSQSDSESTQTLRLICSG